MTAVWKCSGRLSSLFCASDRSRDPTTDALYSYAPASAVDFNSISPHSSPELNGTSSPPPSNGKPLQFKPGTDPPGDNCNNVDVAATHVDTMSVSRELYEFLIDAELGHYHSALKNELKIASVQQLKYVREEDLLDIGMSRPEMRRLKKYYRREHPQGIERIYRAIKKTPSDVGHRLSRPLSPGGMQDPRSSRAHYIRPPGKQIIPAHCLVINKTLGEGEFGVVQQGIWTTEEGEKVQVAIKCLSKDRMQSATADFLKEAGIMQSTDHEHLVRMFGVVLDKENALMLVTELAPMRSLLECLKAPSLRLDFPIIRLCEFSQQICDGMSYLESKRLIHRDLAARNVLVFSKHQVKISDFGLSRALGVGKDYYQCKFTSTLKLPIAWCAPETINYLKFTSASDVWSFAVTLWELFTYGFQPWAGLTGQQIKDQILDTIDTPRCQHLDQPELCPQEYYQLMCKCWEYEPQDRPTFSQIFMKLPQIRPILVKAVRDAVDSGRNDFLIFKAYEVIVVIDKIPSDAPWPGLWKGALNNGRSGLFDPTNTVPFLEPKMSPIEHKANIVRRESSRKSSRKIRLDMIGKPMDDLRHTGHIGYDGAIFGDVSFIGDNVDKLPIKRSNPVLVIPRPSLAKLHPHHARVGIDRSLNSLTVNFQKTAGSMADVGGSSISLQRFSDSPDRDHPVRVSQSELSLLQQQPNTSNGIQNTWMSKESLNSRVDDGHDGRRTPPYQDIDDDDDTGGLLDDFDFKLPDLSSSLDFGPSLMDEVFKALSERQVSADSTPESDNLSNNHIKGDSPPLPAPRRDYSAEPPPVPTSVPRAELRREVNGGRPVDHKHQVKVKPMSTSDQKLMEEAIHYAHEFSRQNSQGYVTEPPVTPPIFTTGDDSGSGSESPRIIEKLKHPFRKTSSSSPKPERVRTFSEEIANKGDDELPAESQEAYNVLVAHRSFGIDSSVRDNEHPVISHPVIISSPRLSNGHALEIRTSVDRSTPKPTVPPRPLPRQYSSDMKKPVEPPPPRPRPEVQRVEPLVRRLSIEEKPLLKSDVSDSNENVDYKDNDGYIPDSDINVPPPRDERSILDDRLGSSAEAFNSNRSSSNTDSSESEASSKSRTEDQQVVELKSSLLFDEEDLEPSPREIMTRLARERRLKRSMDHQNHVEVSESAIPMPNRNIREPQGIPGMKPAPLATAENDVEVETNPLRMLRGGAIPIRGSRGGIQGNSSVLMDVVSNSNNVLNYHTSDLFDNCNNNHPDDVSSSSASSSFLSSSKLGFVNPSFKFSVSMSKPVVLSRSVSLHADNNCMDREVRAQESTYDKLTSCTTPTRPTNTRMPMFSQSALAQQEARSPTFSPSVLSQPEKRSPAFSRSISLQPETFRTDKLDTTLVVDDLTRSIIPPRPPRHGLSGVTSKRSVEAPLPPRLPLHTKSLHANKLHARRHALLKSDNNVSDMKTSNLHESKIPLPTRVMSSRTSTGTDGFSKHSSDSSENSVRSSISDRLKLSSSTHLPIEDLHDSLIDLPIAPPVPIDPSSSDSGEAEWQVMSDNDNVFLPATPQQKLLTRCEGRAATFPRRKFLRFAADVTSDISELGYYDTDDAFWRQKLPLPSRKRFETDSSEDMSPIPANYKTSEHVSYEDLLEFALDRPTSCTAIETLQKIFGNELTVLDCTHVLEATKWNVTQAIKFVKLHQLLSVKLGNVNECKTALMKCDWNVLKAANQMLSFPLDSPEVIEL